MKKYLCTSVETYRMDTMEEAKAFQTQLEADALNQGYAIKNYAMALKSTKNDVWVQVKVSKVFQLEREPSRALNSITYVMEDDPMFGKEDTLGD